MSKKEARNITLFFLTVACLVALIWAQNAQLLLIIPGTDPGNRPNYTIAIGNDDCFASFQTGDNFGLTAFCPTEKR